MRMHRKRKNSSLDFSRFLFLRNIQWSKKVETHRHREREKRQRERERERERGNKKKNAGRKKVINYLLSSNTHSQLIELNKTEEK